MPRRRGCRLVRATLILTAVDLEARALARELELPPLAGLPFPAFGRGAIRVAPVGLRASRLAERWPALHAGLERPLVISAGVCAGLDPDLAVGDLVLPERIVAPGGRLLDVSPSDHRSAAAIPPSPATGRLATTRDVVATLDAKAALFCETGAIAADMESAFIAEAAAAAGLPCLVVRAVSDAAQESLPPELIRLVSPDGRVRLAAAASLLARPALMSRALGLRRAVAHALRAVARRLAALPSEPVRG